MTIVFRGDELVPEAWRRERMQRVRTFNPGIVRDADGWVMAYRVVGEPDLHRRIALCRLDERFRVVPGSALPVSDWIVFDTGTAYPAQATSWFADPRLYLWDGRLYLYWNSGWHEPRNEQFLVELDRRTWRPLTPARELRLEGTRQKLEKNWVLFQHGSEHFAIYSVNPYHVLRFSPNGEGPVVFTTVGTPCAHDHGYARSHGGLRGGTPPQRVGAAYYSFCHSIEDDPAGYRYVAAAYRFSAEPPFRLEAMPNRPLALDIPSAAQRVWPKLNSAVGHVVYPSGAVWCDDRWVISLGVDDETCVVTEINPRDVDASLVPVS